MFDNETNDQRHYKACGKKHKLKQRNTVFSYFSKKSKYEQSNSTTTGETNANLLNNIQDSGIDMSIAIDLEPTSIANTVTSDTVNNIIVMRHVRLLIYHLVMMTLMRRLLVYLVVIMSKSK